MLIESRTSDANTYYDNLINLNQLVDTLGDDLSLPLFAQIVIQYGLKSVDANIGAFTLYDKDKPCYKVFFSPSQQLPITLENGFGLDTRSPINNNKLPYISLNPKHDNHIYNHADLELGQLIYIPILDNRSQLLASIEVSFTEGFLKLGKIDISPLNSLAVIIRYYLENSPNNQLSNKAKAYLSTSHNDTSINEPDTLFASLILEQSRECLMVVDKHLSIIFINQAFTQLTGYTATDVKGQRPNILSSGKHPPSFYKNMWQQLKIQGYWEGEIWNRKKDGKVYPQWLTISQINDEFGQLKYYAGFFSALSIEDNQSLATHSQRHYDSLTGLANRELFEDKLIDKLKHHSQQAHAILILDIIRFKNINESLGHKTGDLILKAVAHKLRLQLPPQSTLARLGSDEFGLIIPTTTMAIAEFCKQTIAAFNQPIVLDNNIALYVPINIGISCYPEHGKNSEDLIKHANTALYEAKINGNNHYQVYTEKMSAGLAERLSIENDLQKAIKEKQLRVAYQPQVDLDSGEVIGFEALLRWPHPGHGFISPDKFIPIAEETGLIDDICQMVLTQACGQIKIWRERYQRDFSMAINFSGKQITRPNIAKRIIRVIDSYDLPRQAIELELTESSLMHNVEAAIEVMDELKSAGIRIAIDDFGTGYSSLNYIKRFAIDKLKIDKSFVQGLNEDKNDMAIVSTIIAMANNLGIKVIAEGVENFEQIVFLHEHGCYEIQGYFYSPAKYPAAIDDLLTNNIKLKLYNNLTTSSH